MIGSVIASISAGDWFISKKRSLLRSLLRRVCFFSFGVFCIIKPLAGCLANTLVSCITLKRRLTGEPFDAEAAAAVIARIFLTALGSFRM